MKKSVLISLIALGISLVGLVIALAAWLQKKKDLICDDFDDSLLPDDDDEEEEDIFAPSKRLKPAFYDYEAEDHDYELSRDSLGHEHYRGEPESQAE